MIEYSGLKHSVWVSEPINVLSYFSEYSGKMRPTIRDLKADCNYDHITMSEIMGTSPTDHQFQELISYCSEDKLDIPGKPPSLNIKTLTTRHRLFDRSKTPKDCELDTLASLQKANTIYPQYLKYNRAITFYNQKLQEENSEENLEVKKDILITIRLHDSVCPNETSKTPVKPYSQEICVLGRQFLSELRDKIYCPIDYTSSSKDRNSLYEETPLLKAKDVFKSGFFFIEDVFYNDSRCSSNVDYSEVIIKWAKDKGIGSLDTGSMSLTKFEDLTVRFGFPYVYQHQGNCEHLIVFSDARLLHESDICTLKSYPLLKSVGRKPVQTCMICCSLAARWITFDNERVPVDPFYFCDGCFKSFNFIDGKKIGHFTFYEFHPLTPVTLPKE